MWASLFSQAVATVPAPPQDGWLIDPELVDGAYRQTMADKAIQTQFPPPEPVPQPPQWLLDLLHMIGRFFQDSAPYLRPTLYVVGALLLLLLLYRFVPAIRLWVDQAMARRKPVGADEVIGHAEAGAARQLLSEADALAGQGRFAEAVHLLLHRSVEDIAKWRPGLVKPALTSRDLAAAHSIPDAARAAFADIARAVEISLFGGQPLDASAWAACRGAYACLTIPQNWKMA